MPSRLQTRRAALTLAATHFAITFVLVAFRFALGWRDGGRTAAWMAGAIYGLAAAQATLLATAATLAPAHFIPRTLVGVGGTLALLLAYPFAFLLGDALTGDVLDADRAAAVSLTLAPALVGAIALGLIARRFGWRWCDETTPDGSPVRFSLRAALIATVAVAAALALCRVAHDHPESFHHASRWLGERTGIVSPDAWWHVWFGAPLAASAALGAAAVAGPRPHAGFVIAAVVASPAIGAAGAWGLAKVAPTVATPAMVGSFTAAVATMSSLLALRVRDWRIDRAPVPTAAATPRDDRDPSTPSGERNDA